MHCARAVGSQDTSHQFAPHPGSTTLKLADHFDVLLKDTVNLGQVRLDLLDSRVSAIYRALQADAEVGPLITGKIPQGSWPQRTIIKPVGTKEFDADFMLNMSEVDEWAESPKTYVNKVYWALKAHPTYSAMELTRKCRCVRVVYANSMHVDIVPHLYLSDGREVIVNRDEDAWEETNPGGFTEWMREQDSIAGGNLRKVIRLLKFLRDHKNSFTGTRSIILTTVLGERVEAWRKTFEPGYYGSVPTALLHLVEDLDEWLWARPSKPSIYIPRGGGATFDHRWDQTSYGYFRERIHIHAAEISAAYHEQNKERSVDLWQGIFGEGFKAPVTSTSNAKFPPVLPAGTTITGRSGRAG